MLWGASAPIMSTTQELPQVGQTGRGVEAGKQHHYLPEAFQDESSLVATTIDWDGAGGVFPKFQETAQRSNSAAAAAGAAHF